MFKKEACNKKTRQPCTRYFVKNPYIKGENLMNTMKDFYASISSVSRLQGPYLQALSEITRINYKQAYALQSDLGWQNWSEQDQKAAAHSV